MRVHTPMLSLFRRIRRLLRRETDAIVSGSTPRRSPQQMEMAMNSPEIQDNQTQESATDRRRAECGQSDAMPQAATAVNEEERKARVRAAAEHALVVHEQTFRRLADT